MASRKDGLTCLFLGSGASAALAGIPIQGKIFIREIIRDGRAWFRTKVGNLNFAEWMEEAGDIELCMSHLHNLAYSGLAGHSDAANDAKTDIINLRTAIAVALSAYPKKTKAIKETQTAFRNLLRRLGRGNRKGRLVILTTNYDLTIERLLASGQYDYPGIIIRGRLQETKIGGTNHKVPIFKLHGSINWLEKREYSQDKKNLIGYTPLRVMLADRHIMHSPMDLPTQGRTFHGYLPSSSKDNRGQTHKLIYTPILIPFFFQKDDWFTQRWSSLLQGHWESAKRHLAENTVGDFVFIGFGLPKADHYLLTWLTSVIQNMKRAPHVTVLSLPPKCGEATLLSKLGLQEDRGNIHMRCELNTCSIRRLEERLLRNGGM